MRIWRGVRLFRFYHSQIKTARSPFRNVPFVRIVCKIVIPGRWYFSAGSIALR